MDINEILTRGVAEVINLDSLKEKLAAGKPLRIKYGVDPTRPDIHLGHAAVLWKLKALQEMGHTIIFLIGDYTTKIGDPSGRNSTRPVLSDQEIKTNAQTYFDQVGKILDVKKTEVRYNSEWFEKMTFADILNISGKFTVAQIIERDDFAKRIKEGNDIGLHEVMYPLMQAYDSVELKADMEIGGTDQKFNILAGRDLQKKMGQSPQEVIFMNLLVGLDGKVKMSKSVGNYIAITDEPADMFGKVMSIPDELIPQYFELCTEESAPEDANPRDQKAHLAKIIVKIYHGEEAAEKAEKEFNNVYRDKQLPEDIAEVKIDGSYRLDDLLVTAKLASSKSEARRLVDEGAITIGDEKQTDAYKMIEHEIIPEKGLIIKKGPHQFAKVVK